MIHANSASINLSLILMSTFVLSIMAYSLTSSYVTSPSYHLKPKSTYMQKKVIEMSADGGIKVVRNPDKTELEKMGVFSWPKWGCDASKFPWTYEGTETCYILKGEVTVTPDDSSIEAVTVGEGDLATFPDGMSCTWDVTKAISKHYKFY